MREGLLGSGGTEGPSTGESILCEHNYFVDSLRILVILHFFLVILTVRKEKNRIQTQNDAQGSF